MYKTYGRPGRPKTEHPKTISMNIAMSEQSRERLEIIATAKGISMAEVVRIALDAYYENLMPPVARILGKSDPE